MSSYKRVITKQEAEELRPYLCYFDIEKDLHDPIFRLMQKGTIFRTPVLEAMAQNFKEINPGHQLPKCLKK